MPAFCPGRPMRPSGCEFARVLAYGSPGYNIGRARHLHVPQVRPIGSREIYRDHEHGCVRLLRYKEGNMGSCESGNLMEAPNGGQGHGGVLVCLPAGSRDGVRLRLASWHDSSNVMCVPTASCARRFKLECAD